MSQFHVFAEAVNARLTELSQHELLVADVGDIYQSYLSAFPEGSNPIFRVRTEHDCSCCRNFLKNMGVLVAVVDGRKQTIWDIPDLPEPYATVAAALHSVVFQARVVGVYRTSMPGHGNRETHEEMEIHGPHGLGHHTHTWNHFYGTVAKRHRSNEPDAQRGELNTTAGVLHRGMTELTPEAITTVLELIAAGTLYRGEQYRAALVEFQKLQAGFRAAPDPELWVWNQLDSGVAKLRNTLIGQLLIDLSDGVDLEAAVRSYEKKAAPENYQRPKALITQRMVDDALKTLADLDLEHAVERRFASIGDVALPNVLWVDNAVRGRMKGGLRETLLGAVVAKPVKEKDALPIDMEAFVRAVLPTATSLELLVKGQHLGNLVSLIAPVYPDTGKLLKWGNDFTWSYRGEVTDSIKQRVKSAGGNIDAALRVSLSWSNYDDLDLHSNGPHGNIYFGDKGGILDVDMNAGGSRSREPVENQSWVKPRDGQYIIAVHQYCKRDSIDTGFTLEIECNGVVTQLHHAGDLSTGQSVKAVSFTMTKGVMSDLKVLDKALAGGAKAVTEWGVKTEGFVPVATVMHSPNHWEGAGAIGHKHLFFMLNHCRNPDPARGLYNEFLRGDLVERHRKVFEVLGARTKCPPTNDQLSGLGFTSGRGDAVTVKVTSQNATRLYTINF